jgi:prolyl-tRNA synthetase
LLLRAKKLMEENLTKTASYDILKSILEKKGGFILTGWCGDEKCENRIKEETGADIRVIPFEGQQESKTTVCVYCQQPAKKMAIFARAY